MHHHRPFPRSHGLLGTRGEVRGAGDGRLPLRRGGGNALVHRPSLWPGRGHPGPGERHRRSRLPACRHRSFCARGGPNACRGKRRGRTAGPAGGERVGKSAAGKRTSPRSRSRGARGEEKRPFPHRRPSRGPRSSGPSKDRSFPPSAGSPTAWSTTAYGSGARRALR